MSFQGVSSKANFKPVAHVSLKQPPKKAKVKEEVDHALPDYDLDSAFEEHEDLPDRRRVG